MINIYIVSFFIVSVISMSYFVSIRFVYLQTKKHLALTGISRTYLSTKKQHKFVILFYLPFIIFVYIGFTYWNAFVIIILMITGFILSIVFGDLLRLRHMNASLKRIINGQELL